MPKPKLPSLESFVQFLATKDDQYVKDLVYIQEVLLAESIRAALFTRKLRKAGPVLTKLRKGEELTAQEAKQLRQLLAGSAYYIASSFRSATRTYDRVLEAIERLQKAQQKPSVPPPNSAKWAELEARLKELRQILEAANARKAAQNAKTSPTTPPPTTTGGM